MDDSECCLMNIKNRLYLGQKGVDIKSKKMKDYKCDGVYDKKDQMVREINRIVNLQTHGVINIVVDGQSRESMVRMVIEGMKEIRVNQQVENEDMLEWTTDLVTVRFIKQSCSSSRLLECDTLVQVVILGDQLVQYSTNLSIMDRAISIKRQFKSMNRHNNDNTTINRGNSGGNRHDNKNRQYYDEQID